MTVLTITARNVNDAYHEAMWKLPGVSRQDNSRNGYVLVSTFPVVTSYAKPTERMLWSPRRDANPFFHVIESMWMLAGRNKVREVAVYAKQLLEYSDDGEKLHGAYGHRWVNHFQFDQVHWVINHLREEPNSRRAVIAMWDPYPDTYKVDNGGRDVPCNTHIYFRINNGKLDMTVCNRSNDVVWGCYGANAVHMSYLQEFVAEALNVPVGFYHQFSNNWHIYERHWNLLKPPSEHDPYLSPVAANLAVPLLHDSTSLDFVNDANTFFEHASAGIVELYRSTYINRVAAPVHRAWKFHKEGDDRAALAAANNIADWAVRLACKSWLERRVGAK